MSKILVGITGGIASYKAASLVSYLNNRGDEVKVMMTKHATEFISPLTFETLSKQKVITVMFNDSEPGIVSHIYYAQEYDLIVVAPATANIIGKVSNGIADDMLSSTLIAANIPILFVPAMNSYMYENKIVQENIKKLKNYGYYFVEPDIGMLACGVEGKGKYPKTEKIVTQIDSILERNGVL